MREAIELRLNEATEEAIALFLKRCDSSFVPPLSTRVEIGEYAGKIARLATRIEAWAGDQLVGLVAVYCNDASGGVAFITNVSVLPEWQAKGLGARMMKKGIAHVRGLGFGRLALEVESSNGAAVRLYTKLGFQVSGEKEGMTTMVRTSGREP